MPIWFAPSQVTATTASTGNNDRELVVEDRLHGICNTTPPGSSRRAGLATRAGQEPEQKADLQASPKAQSPAGEGEIGTRNGRVRAAAGKPPERRRKQGRTPRARTSGTSAAGSPTR